MAEVIAPVAKDHYGRNKRSIIVLVAVWGVLGALVLAIDFSPRIAGFMALFSLPILWEILANPKTMLRLNADSLEWGSAANPKSLKLDQIERVRFDTRLDMSVRVTVITAEGRKTRLPPQVVPPHRSFEQALIARGVKTERRHFSLF